jgi:hypothetical protein
MYTVRSHDGDIEYGINEYVCDVETDLQSLPRCKMGSVALVLRDSTSNNQSVVYVKDGNGEWRPI